MPGSDNPKSQIRYARLAGFLYLFTYVVPITGWAITGHMEVAGNIMETAHRIMASELLYRFGLTCQLINNLCCMALAMSLYVAVKPIDGNVALFALLFRMAENTLDAMWGILSFVALKVYLTAGVPNALNSNQGSFFINLYSDSGPVEFNVVMVFLGAGSLLFFSLFLKSSYIPKVISAWGVFASVVFILVSFAGLFWPQYKNTLQLGWLPMALAEVVTGFWLLIKGVNVPLVASQE